MCLLDESTFQCRKISDPLQARTGSKALLSLGDLSRLLWPPLATHAPVVLYGDKGTFERVQVLCGLQIADEETSFTIDWLNDAAVVLRVHLLFRRRLHFQIIYNIASLIFICFIAPNFSKQWKIILIVTVRQSR